MRYDGLASAVMLLSACTTMTNTLSGTKRLYEGSELPKAQATSLGGMLRSGVRIVSIRSLDRDWSYEPSGFDPIAFDVLPGRYEVTGRFEATYSREYARVTYVTTTTIAPQVVRLAAEAGGVYRLRFFAEDQKPAGHHYLVALRFEPNEAGKGTLGKVSPKRGFWLVCDEEVCPGRLRPELAWLPRDEFKFLSAND